MPGGAELSEKLPDEFFQLVESFKKFVREQKAYRDQKFDVDLILEVGRDTEEFALAFQRVAVDSDRNSQLVQQIKDDTSKLLRNAELAYSLLRSHLTNNLNLQEQQHQQQQQQQQQITNPLTGQATNVNTTTTSATNIGVSNLINLSSSVNSSTNLNDPRNQNQNQLFGPRLGGSNNLQQSQQQTSTISGQQQTFLHQQQPFYLNGNPSYSSGHHNQFVNSSSSRYFDELADQFEARMKAYGEQIKELKMSLDSITRAYNVDELFKWLKKQHETLGEIAAKIYMTHERIMEKKTEMDKFNTAQQQNNLKTNLT